MHKYSEDCLICKICEKHDKLELSPADEAFLKKLDDELRTEFEKQEKLVWKEFVLIKKVFKDSGIQFKENHISDNIDIEPVRVIGEMLPYDDFSITKFTYDIHMYLGPLGKVTNLEDFHKITKLIKSHKDYEELESINIIRRSNIQKLRKKLKKTSDDFIDFIRSFCKNKVPLIIGQKVDSLEIDIDIEAQGYGYKGTFYLDYDPDLLSQTKNFLNWINGHYWSASSHWFTGPNWITRHNRDSSVVAMKSPLGTFR